MIPFTIQTNAILGTWSTYIGDDTFHNDELLQKITCFKYANEY